jgi:hypothetical protein
MLSNDIIDYIVLKTLEMIMKALGTRKDLEESKDGTQA